MLDYMNQVAAHEEHLKDLQRLADNERLARQVVRNESHLLRNARNTLGQGLVKVGQKLMDEKQR